MCIYSKPSPIEWFVVEFLISCKVWYLGTCHNVFCLFVCFMLFWLQELPGGMYIRPCSTVLTSLRSYLRMLPTHFLIIGLLVCSDTENGKKLTKLEEILTSPTVAKWSQKWPKNRFFFNFRKKFIKYSRKCSKRKIAIEM